MAKSVKEKTEEKKVLLARLKQLKDEEREAKPKELKMLGDRIKKLRKDLGYTSQETFANDVGYAISYYSRLERGEDIRFTSLIKVCNALGVTLEEFFEGFDFPKSGIRKNKK